MENKGQQPKRKAVKIASKSPHVAYFSSMLESFAARDDLNEVVKNRVVKACDLLDAGVALYPNDFQKKDVIEEVLQNYGGYDVDALEALSKEKTFAIAGRIMALRSFGKAAFFHVMDQSGRLQCYAVKADMGDEAYAIFKKFDIGDIVGCEGFLFLTQTGELTLHCTNIRLLSRSMRPLPEKYHGLKDMETRYRQRYVDLIVTPKTREIFQKRSQVVREFRNFMEEQGFLEVETPMMQPIAGGATARPFVTHHNTLDMQMYLRIAPELYLKRLLVGGLEKVFEINRNFRNEGISTRHNPEFTMCEFYWAYATFEDLMDLTENLLGHITEKVCGSHIINYQGQEINMTPGTWKRLSFHGALEEIGGHAPEFYQDYQKVREYVRSRGEKVVESESLGKLQAKLFDLDVEAKLVQPTFIYHYPTDISPLSRRNDKNPDITDRYEFFIVGREHGNAFSELNDPMDQRGRFEDQVREKEAGDDEACAMDEDYLRALEYAMPPAAGQGIGIDRLVMLLTDSPSIREVILFPLLKSEG